MGRTFVISDIHGEYEKFLYLLEKIRFDDDDLLFVLGDMIDRGPEPIKVVEDLSMRHNAICLLGNHEYMALRTLRKLDVEITSENWKTQLNEDVMRGFMEWMRNGGEVTLKQYRALDRDRRDGILEFMEDLLLYEQVKVGGQAFVLVHAGLMNFSPARPLLDYAAEELIFERPDYRKPYFQKVITISGHTPTLTITGKPEIYHANNHIVIDCGAVFAGGRLAALELDTMEETYV